MSIEHFTWYVVTAFSIASVFYIPGGKHRLALVSFLTAQAVSWASSLIFVQIGWIAYPVREFSMATRAGFLHLFVFMPILYMWFILLFPRGTSLVKKVLHYFVFVSLASWFVYFICVYTNLLKFTKGSFTFQFIALYIRYFIFFFTMRIYITWFSKKSDWTTEG